ncbi:P-loop containing nucleoside triphosphate hydrolase protein, partial [Mycena sanguinolenta]
MLHHLGKFTETLHKIHAFVEAQQEGHKMKTLFRYSESNALLRECQAGLQDAFDVFKVEFGVNLLNSIEELQQTAETMHQELLELISGFSDETTSDRVSWIYHNVNDSQISYKSFSMLPSQPKIFHGRDMELEQILKMLQQESPRIAILGPGGIGKTSLTRAALHHPSVASKYEHRLFVSCEAAMTAMDIAAAIGASLDLKPARNLTQPVIQALSAKVVSLLILDNLESSWESLTTRSGVEELLSLLTDIPGLALMVTIRGAEHPAKVRWTRPFLPPLKPLSDEAARQTFIDIADDDYEEIEELLRFTGNMPLAVDLMAHLVVYDGTSSVLARWETEKTSLLSEGFDKRSNLDASIAMSLSSPRLSSSPGAMDLLCLLSILPDGLSDAELFQSNLPIKDLMACKAVLLSTSLAYNDDKKRLKSLVPIREHVQQFHPVQPWLVKSLQQYFAILLDLYQKYFGTLQTAGMIKQIAHNLANLHQILLQGLKPENPDLANTVACAISLNMYSRRTGRGRH